LTKAQTDDSSGSGLHWYLLAQHNGLFCNDDYFIATNTTKKEL